MKNNLFRYASSELSQDAFVCWLVSHAFKDVTCEPELADCARNLLALFVPEFVNRDSICLSDIQRQVGNRRDGYIDILLSVYYEGILYKIIVEDKTFSEEHDNQLERYLLYVQADAPEAVVKGVYYKTGFQSDTTSAEAAGYEIVTRKRILSFLAGYVGKVQNRILLDYFEYWSAFQRESERYREIPSSQWGWKQINGYYNDLKESCFFEERDLWSGFGYVANPNGGFHGLWTGCHNFYAYVDGVEVELFLQMEAASDSTTSIQLCLKLCAKDVSVESNIVRQARDKIVYRGGSDYALRKYNFVKPKRLGSGRHMTIGIYDADLSNYEEIAEAFDAAILDYKRLLQDVRKN